MTVLIRTIERNDAEALTALLRVVDGETRFLLYEPGERTTTAAEWAARIAGMRSDGTGEMFVAVDGELLAGFLSVYGDKRQRVRHAAEVFVAVRQSHAGQGIGTRLFEAMEAWARAHGIHRLQLQVAVDNPAGLALYHKFGFRVEGLLRHAVRVEGRWGDDYVMARLLE